MRLNLSNQCLDQSAFCEKLLAVMAWIRCVRVDCFYKSIMVAPKEVLDAAITSGN